MTSKVLDIDKTKTAVLAEMAHDEMQQYSAVAKALGISHPKARLEELKAFLSENGITVYPVEKVDAYLRAKVAKEEGKQTYWCWKPVRSKDRRSATRESAANAPESIEAIEAQVQSTMYQREYERLRYEHDRARSAHEAHDIEQRLRDLDRWLPRARQIRQWEVRRVEPKHGSFVSTVYPHAIPLAVLLTMEKIQYAFPEAQFQASDYEVERPDPFLAVMLPETDDLFIIERWDEPGFRM